LPARVQGLLVQAQGHLQQLEALMEQGERDICEHARHEAAQRLCALNDTSRTLRRVQCGITRQS